MKLTQEPLSFRQVLPSALTILALGSLLSLFVSSWYWLAGLGWLVIPYGLLLGLAIYLLGFILSCSWYTRTASMQDLLNTLHQLFRNFTWPQIIVVSILAGVGEELLIRAVLQTFLVNTAGPLWGIAVASLIFGLLHFMTKTYVLLTFALGFLFGLAFHFTGSIVLVMLAHTVYDIVAFAMIVKFPHMLGVDLNHDKKSIITERFY
ncbi:MAG: membrane protease YdiL (CAAX protease family) [Arenicella sp.]|jgi:membrane protease YdiL (CAAX protease family)